VAGAEDVLGRDYQSAGRLSAAVLAELGLPREAEAYICGPAEFMTDVAAAPADRVGQAHTGPGLRTPRRRPDSASAFDVKPARHGGVAHVMGTLDEMG
jgi:ferredoxin-NADP reductase